MHSSKEAEKLWLAEWGYAGLFISLSSSRTEVCILFNSNFAFEILKYYLDPEGRFITVDIKTQDKIKTLQDIYAPNNDDCDFVKNAYHNLFTFDRWTHSVTRRLKSSTKASKLIRREGTISRTLNHWKKWKCSEKIWI